MSMPMLAGVGLLVVCCSSSAAAVIMRGREEKEDPDVPSTTTGTDSGADDSGADKAAADKAAADKAATDKAAADKAAADKAAADKAAADAVAATAAAAAAANAAAAAEQTRIASFTVGTPVQCTANDVGSGANSAVYRLEAGKKLRHYPNPPIATSWDADWGTTFEKIDCTGFTQGPSMAHNVTVGTPVQCTANDVGSGVNSAVYRVEAGKKLRHYPNPPIASSWDPDWGTTFKKIDCQGFTQGPSMAHNVTVGDPVQCTANDVGSGVNSAVYRVEAGKKLRHYPNPPIATSWDADWGTTYKKIDCIGFTQGPGMAHNVTVGTPVQCTANDVGSGANSAVYRVEAGKKLRHYPNPPIATSWDADWGTTYKKIDCIGFTQGPAMAHK
jgi:hypothetical protein